jgi:IS5 family transposase
MQGSSRPDRELLDAAVLCRHLVPEGSVHALLADHRQRLFPDEMFADLFGSGRGRPSVPADVIATVMVLQALEGLSDREATRQLATNIAWKAAAGLAITDEAFHPTVLTLWRNKLRSSESPQRIFDAVRAVITESGVLTGRTRRAIDSTVLDDAVARQDTITMLVTQIRRARRLIPELAEIWVREHNLEGSRPPCDWGDPADVDRLVSELVDDANELVWAAEDLDLDEAQADAVALLALVAGQDVEPGDGPGRWRIARRTAPDRVISTIDPESRHTHKTNHAYRDGYKAHVAAEPDTGLVTGFDLTGGNTSDAQTAPSLLDDEPDSIEILGDSAYGTGDLRAHLRDRHMTAVIKPPPLRPAVEGGYTLDDFDIDETAGIVTCPAGIAVALTPARVAYFKSHCDSC